MQTQAEIGALIGRLAMADEDFCEILLVTVARLRDAKPDALLPDDAANLAGWIHFIRGIRYCCLVR